MLHFRDKNNQIKNEEGEYPPHFDEPTGQFRSELTGCYPWSESYGIDRNFQGNYEAEELLKILFAKIFEMVQLLYEEKVKHDREVAERKREEEAAERARKNREKEFNDIKELIHEYKVHKELTGLKEFIKSTKAPKASMDEMLWYKATLKWLDDKSRMDNGLSQYQHEDLINYLLDEKTTKETEFNDNRYRW
ncbi:hypothetical protein [Macrococcus bovicus]|uniref:Uncharacterized protein n=1 Tax=Macrococcus bovicus TaxID=69968 RepID=A0A4R6BYG5_9STAP|nr:hypothetical protein [Macrococcus bovicus]TDM13572.1 hypothetical protein ERX55_08235 [Macrococcus bovicus]